MEKKRVHINAINKAIDWIFCERIKQIDLIETDTYLDAIECIDNVNYVYRKINRRDKKELIRIAQIKLSIYLIEHPDNSFELFKEINIERAKDYQTYFPDYKTNNKQKEIYFDLQKWVEVLETVKPNTNIPLNTSFEIEPLKYNTLTLPESIYKYFCSLGHERSFVSYKGERTYGDLLPPFRTKYLFVENNNEYQCFILEKYYQMFEYGLLKGEMEDEQGNILNKDSVREFLLSYAKGFQKGYFEFIKTISNKELFDSTDKDLAYKIFERVYNFPEAEVGNITIRKTKYINDKTKYYITKDLFFETGYKGGEFFKAWELILNKPMLFKEFFDAITPTPKALPPQQDIEPMTIEKLKFYGFDEVSIERLFTWKNYESYFINNRGYFVASNIDQKIYSGKIGREKHFTRDQKSSFKTFDEMFNYLHSIGAIEQQENKVLLSLDKRIFEMNFNLWLQNFKGWEYGNETMYISFLTKENWVEYLVYKEKESKEFQQRNEAERASWRLPQQIDKNTEQETKTEKNNEDLEKIFSEIKSLENKFWKGLPMAIVIKHFEVMTQRKNKNNKVYLTSEQLVSFLKKGFLNDTTQPKQKIDCTNGEKGFVIKRFYEFFTLAVSQYSYPQRKKRFITLFDDCFDNWEQSTIEPFFKPNKTKENW